MLHIFQHVRVHACMQACVLDESNVCVSTVCFCMLCACACAHACVCAYACARACVCACVCVCVCARVRVCVWACVLMRVHARNVQTQTIGNEACPCSIPVSAKKTPAQQHVIDKQIPPHPQTSMLKHGWGACGGCEINARVCKACVLHRTSTLSTGGGGHR